MIKECKKCGSKNLYLEPRINGQDILTSAMVALKCKDCGSWIKWCPKNKRVNYLKIEKPDKWQKLKEWLEEDIEKNHKENDRTDLSIFLNYIAVEQYILQKMQELEGKDDANGSDQR